MKKFFAGIFSVLLILTLCLGICLFTFEKSLEKKSIEKIVSQTDLTVLIEQENIDLNSFYQTFEEVGIEKQQVDKVINSKLVKNTATEITNNILDYYLRGEEGKKILTEKQLDSFLKDFLLTCEDLLQVSLKEEEENQIYNMTKPILQEIEKELPTVEEIQQQDPELTSLVQTSQFIFGKELKFALLLIGVISFLGIYLLRRKKHAYLTWYGVDTIISSILLALLFGITYFALSSTTFDETEKVISFLTNSFVTRGWIISSTLFVIGIILLILHHFVEKRGKEQIENK